MATTQEPTKPQTPTPGQPPATPPTPTKHETFVHSYSTELGLDRPDCMCATCKDTRSYLQDGSVKDTKRDKIIFPAGEVRRDVHGDLVWLRNPGRAPQTPSQTPPETPPATDARAAGRALLRTVIEGANAPLLARRAELDARILHAKEQLAELLKDPAIVAAQDTLAALKEQDAALVAQLRSVYDALAALDAPPAPPATPERGTSRRGTPAQGTASGVKKPDNFPMRFFQEFNKYYKGTGVTQKTLTARCKAADIDLSDRSEANIDLAYAMLLEAGEIA